MSSAKSTPNDYDGPVEIYEGIYWIGFYDKQAGLHCNPYLIVDNDEALVIDGGSRPDFATVMMKILQTGVVPNKIAALVYSHYDPDICGSIPNFENIIKRKDLKLISDSDNLMFIRHYSVSSRLIPISSINHQYTFSSGRTIQFLNTPYCHSGGSFVTFDPQSKILFTSDLFGSYSIEWELFLSLPPECVDCVNLSQCPMQSPNCPIADILYFHKKIMPSKKALRYAIEKILELPFSMIAPQHGSILKDRETVRFIFEQLGALEDVGIDGIIKDNHVFKFNNLIERLKENGN